MKRTTHIELECNSADALIIAEWPINSRETARVSIETLLVARGRGLVGDELPRPRLAPLRGLSYQQE
jgi:hypothetical protein